MKILFERQVCVLSLTFPNVVVFVDDEREQKKFEYT